MTSFYTITLILFAFCATIFGMHQLCHNAACFDNGDTQITMTFDGDELLYVDFNNESIVWESRLPSDLHPLYIFDYAVTFKTQCKFHLQRWMRDPSVTKSTAAPEVLIYPRDQVMDQIDNTLICFIRHFFPPTIKIKWTKNIEVVESDDPFEKMIPSSDGTFQVFSTLTFVPKDGDIYACTVEHEALKEPMARFFEVHSSGTDYGPTAYCTVCVILGILGCTGGVFLLFKNN